MNHRLPPDIDRLLWEVAESQDPAAFDDFEVRFPHLVVELGKRIKLVRELRDARAGGAETRKPVPRFDRRQPARAWQLTPGLAVAGVLILASLGFGAYVITTHAVGTRPEPIVNAQGVSTSGATLPNVAPILKPSNEQNQPSTGGDGSQVKTPPDTSTTNQAVPPYLRPTNVSFDRAKLQVALLAVAESGGLQIEFAPNTPNPDIRMQYRGMNSIDILKDMGLHFGFTAFSQGGNHVLIVPARDPGAQDEHAATGSGTAENLDAPNTPTEGQPGPNVKKPKANHLASPL